MGSRALGGSGFGLGNSFWNRGMMAGSKRSHRVHRPGSAGRVAAGARRCRELYEDASMCERRSRSTLDQNASRFCSARCMASAIS